MILNGWQKEHHAVISDFLKHLNSATSDFILKGGTSLMMCYNLDRFSENIELDAQRGNENIGSIIDDFCKRNNYLYDVKKDTDTVKKFMIYYTGQYSMPLKVEISYRRKNIDKDEITNKNGIAVYTINNLFYMKSSAYQIKGEIRDLYDICFLCNNYWESLSEGAINALRTFVEYKGIEQFNYIIHMQSDELIDNEKLADDFLKMYDKLGFFYTEEEKYFLVQDKQFKMEKLFPPEYRQGYLRALLDTEKVLQSLELDLQRCKRRITKKILHQALYEIQNNSANLRENIGFLRWNLENERPEWFIPIHKKETMTESNTPS